MDNFRQKVQNYITINSFSTAMNKMPKLPFPIAQSQLLAITPRKQDALQEKIELWAMQQNLAWLGESDTIKNAILPLQEVLNAIKLPILATNEFNSVNLQEKLHDFVSNNVLCSMGNIFDDLVPTHLSTMPILPCTSNTKTLEDMQKSANTLAEQKTVLSMDKALALLQHKAQQRKKTSFPPNNLSIKGYFYKLRRAHKEGQISLEKFKAECQRHPELIKKFTEYQERVARLAESNAD